MKLRQTLPALLITTAVIAGGCNNKKSTGPDIVTETWIKNHIAVEGSGTTVTEAEGQKALEFLKLMEPGDTASWSERTGSAGNYVFKDLKNTDEKFHIESLKVVGLRMLDEDTPIADRLEITNFSVMPEDDVKINMKSMQIVLPEAEKMIEMFDQLDSGNMMNLQQMFRSGDANFTVGGGYIEGVSIESDEVNFNMDFAGWAEDEDERKMSLLIKNWAGSAEEGKDDVEFSVGLISLSGFDLEHYDNMFGNNIAGMNPFDPNVESMVAKDVKINADAVVFAVPKFEGWYSDKKDGKFYGYTTMPSMTIGFEGESEDPDLLKMKENLNKMGYERLEFSMDGKTFMDETNDLVEIEKFDLMMKDGFDLSVDYKVTGLKKMVTAMGEMTDRLTESFGADATPPDNMDPEALLQEAFSDLKIHNVEVIFDDNSILERAFKFQAEEQGVGIDLIKQQAKGGIMMSTLAAKSEYQAELAQDFAENMTKLIDEGGSFKFSVNPSDDLDVSKITEQIKTAQAAAIYGTEGVDAPNPDDIIKLFGIDFEHISD